jgi:DNA repair protein RadC
MKNKIAVYEVSKTWKVCEDFEVGYQVNNQIKVAKLMYSLGLNRAPTEEFWVLLLDGKHRVQGTMKVSVGTLTTSLVHPREVFAIAITERAAAIIVCHNHPSGDTTPSAEDLALTKRLHAAGDLLGIPLLDHVVIGGCEDLKYASVREIKGGEL